MPRKFNRKSVEAFVELVEQVQASRTKNRNADALFRILYSTHLSLSRMADHKAHLMLGMNTFVLSFVVSKRKMGVLTHISGLLIPDILLVLLCLSCIVLAILATRPVMPRKKEPGKQINWLFFGDFTFYPLKTFDANMDILMENPTAREEAISRDLYWLGVSLARKYRLLALCYRVFYSGLILISVVFAAFFIQRF